MRNPIKKILRGAATALFAIQILCPQTAMAKAETRKPNIIFFLVDDLGWPDVGCYGSSFYETPAIDQMAKDGVKFDNAYATCHVCSPSRASILTGKYPARTDLTEWIGGKKEMDHEKLHSAKKAKALPEGEITIAEALRRHGYATANYGKAHVARDPKTYGFDEEITGWLRSFHAPFRSHGGKYEILQAKKGDYFTDKLTDAALDFIERKKDQPFFVHLEHFAVHDPIEGRKDLVEKYKKKLAKMGSSAGPDYILEGNPDEAAPSEASLAEMKKNQRSDDFINTRVGWVKQKQDNVEFAGMVGAMDESLARIRAKLEELNIADNTIIIFTSDNGGMSATNRFQINNNRVQMDHRFSSSMLPLRGGKGWLYEGGIRVPLIVYWPGHNKAGMVTDVPVTGTDFYPTLLEMLDLPLMPQQHKDGISFAPLLKGKPFNGHDAIYWHFPHYSNHGNQSPGGAVRVGNYKLLEYFENGTVQLFDLDNDLGEQTDISKQNPETTQKLLKMLQDWRQETDAKMPDIKTPESVRRKFPFADAVKKKFPGNPLHLRTSSCGKRGNPGFREAYNGRENVIASIPVEGSRGFSFNMVKRVDPKKKYKLLLEVGHEQGHFWTLIVADTSKGNHKRLLTGEISDKTATDGWKTVEVDLPQGRSSIPLQLTSYYDGKVPVYWSNIDIVEVEE
jgi:arylsulfatase A-like enzyme